MDKQKAIELLEQGFGGDAVAQYVGCDPKGVGRKIQMWPELAAAMARGKQRIIYMRVALGMTPTQIAAQTGRNRTSVSKLLWEAELLKQEYGTLEQVLSDRPNSIAESMVRLKM